MAVKTPVVKTKVSDARIQKLVFSDSENRCTQGSFLKRMHARVFLGADVRNRKGHSDGCTQRTFGQRIRARYGANPGCAQPTSLSAGNPSNLKSQGGHWIERNRQRYLIMTGLRSTVSREFFTDGQRIWPWSCKKKWWRGQHLIRTWTMPSTLVWQLPNPSSMCIQPMKLFDVDREERSSLDKIISGC